MKIDNDSLLLGVFIGVALCKLFGSANQDLMGLLAIVTVVQLFLTTVDRKRFF
jgi:hypothetical protein